MRIASLSPAATEILFALGAGGQIVCRDQFSNFPEEAKRAAQVMGHQIIDTDDVLHHAPDLILTETVIQEKLAAELKEKKSPIVHLDPRTLGEVIESIAQIGVLCDKEEQAKTLMTSMLKEITSLKTKAKLLPRKLKVYVEEWHKPPMASGNWVPELVTAAGGIAFPIPAGQLSREVTLEEVVGFDPDLIVISWCGAGLSADKSLLTERAGWDRLRAVQNQRVRVIDDSLLNRPGPRLIDGAKRLYGWIVETAHG